ncbi:MAG: acyltransferase family protein [Ruminococcus sp.]|nr:acyltransferase family protein [Ruminococcus sp.]
MLKKLNLDIWRLIVTFLIVAIHISPFVNISPTFDFFFTRILSRIGVPLFFMITGFYILDKSLKDSTNFIKYLKKIIKLYLFAIALYIPINIYMGKFNNITLLEVFKDLIFNGTLYHLWYFPALIIGLIIVYFLNKKLNIKIAFTIAFILYLLGLFGDSYYGIITNIPPILNIYNFLFNIFDYTRNGLFFAPVFLELGYIIKTSKPLKNNSLLYSLIFFIILTFEGLLLYHFNLQKHDSMYLSLIPFMYFFFNYIITHNKTNNRTIRNIATTIYLFHPLFIIIVRFISKIIDMPLLINNNLVLYLIVSLSTTILACILEKIKNCFIIRKRDKNA